MRGSARTTTGACRTGARSSAPARAPRAEASRGRSLARRPAPRSARRSLARRLARHRSSPPPTFRGGRPASSRVASSSPSTCRATAGRRPAQRCSASCVARGRRLARTSLGGRTGAATSRSTAPRCAAQALAGARLWRGRGIAGTRRCSARRGPPTRRPTLSRRPARPTTRRSTARGPSTRRAAHHRRRRVARRRPRLRGSPLGSPRSSSWAAIRVRGSCC
mmetsp:Transcript_19194/g.54001  ORF Transcript_19194/g.54001 Transcript_19194/m.54001 type:complete len:221 (+) Transcript_19194:563-1225(+)